MNARPRGLLLLCGLIPALAIVALSLYRPSPLRSSEYRVYDTLARAVPTRPPGGRIVIVDVDERSLALVGQWPWRRNVIASLIHRLRDSGASTVALDIIFAESDRYEGSGESPDQVLADTLRGGRVVVGYAMTFDAAPAPSGACAQHPLPLAIVRGGDEGDDPFFRATGTICSLPVLTEAAGASGFLNAAPDPDGLLRRVPLLLESDGRVYPGLALAAVAGTTGARDFSLRVADVNTSSLMFGGRIVPLDGKGNMLLRYRGAKHTFPYVSAADVLSGRASADTFRGKVVFVGTTALGTREVVTTPVDTLFTGVEVQATVADNLLQQDSIHRPAYAVTVETQMVLVLCLVVTLLVRRFGLSWGGLGAAASLAMLWAVALWLMSSKGIFLSPFYPTVGLTLTLTSTGIAALSIERRRAEQSREQREASQRLMVQTLLSLTEVRDSETGRHSRRTGSYARVLAEQLATHPRFRDYLTRERITLLADLAPLHDIGKVGVSDQLLHKPGSLTPEELAEMRKHPAFGRDVIALAERRTGIHDDVALTMAKEIIYTHHERWDGTGYPQGLRGADIPIAGRLMALVDVYDAAVSHRPYSSAISHDQAVSLIVAGRERHFDPAVVDAFLRVLPRFSEILERS
jgi:CHASE2 domain-containing sensor protein